MNLPLAPAQARPAPWPRRLVNLLVALVVIAVAAATFVFSYDGVHAIALLGGVSAQLARYYPGLFDALLVIAAGAALVLRDGRWLARAWAWLVIIVLLAAIGSADVLHAMNYALRHRLTEGIVAAAPVVAVLLAFSLLLAVLRQSRTRAAAETPAVLPAAAVRPPAPPIALPAGPSAAPPFPVFDADADAYGDADLAPTHDEPVLTAVPSGPATAGETDLDAADREAEPTAYAVTEPVALVTSAPEAAARRQSIRYADWETEDAGQFAGLVYAAHGEREQRDDAAAADADAAAADDAADGSGDDDAPGSGEPAPRREAPEPDDDAPPFATAPFAPVPRLNRVRSMPAPPADEDE